MTVRLKGKIIQPHQCDLGRKEMLADGPTLGLRLALTRATRNMLEDGPTLRLRIALTDHLNQRTRTPDCFFQLTFDETKTQSPPVFESEGDDLR